MRLIQKPLRGDRGMLGRNHPDVSCGAPIGNRADFDTFWRSAGDMADAQEHNAPQMDRRRGGCALCLVEQLASRQGNTPSNQHIRMAPHRYFLSTD